MITDDELMGVEKPKMDEMREIKVKLPVRQLLLLHYAKLTTTSSISEVVVQALASYFEAQAKHAPSGADGLQAGPRPDGFLPAPGHP